MPSGFWEKSGKSPLPRRFLGAAGGGAEEKEEEEKGHIHINPGGNASKRSRRPLGGMFVSFGTLGVDLARLASLWGS